MLPSLTAAFFLGLLCGAELSFFPLSVIVLLAGIAVGFSLLERVGHIDSSSVLLLYVSLLSGVVYWSLTTPTAKSPQMSPPLHEAVQTSVVGRIIAPVQCSMGRQTILLQTDGSGSESRHIRLVWRDPSITLHHGDRISFRGKLHRPRGSLNPGGFDYAAYMERQGIDFLTTVTGAQAVTLLDAETHIGLWRVWNRIDHWRATIRAAAVNTLGQPTRGLFLGMIIGERGYLEQELQDWFMVTGTVHLLSISGSHLGLVAIVVFWVVKRLILGLPSILLLTLSRIVTPSKIAILLAWPAVALYALLAGAELATVRSLVMITLAMIAMWLGHERHLGHAMAVALLAILWHDPRAVFDISFQLSFLSVLAMVRMIVITESWNADAAGGRQSVEILLHAPCARSAVDERGSDCGYVAHGCVLFQSGSVDGNHHQPHSRAVYRDHLGPFGTACRSLDDYDGGRVVDLRLRNGAIVRVNGSWIAVVCPFPRRGVACGGTIHAGDRALLLRVACH